MIQFIDAKDTQGATIYRYNDLSLKKKEKTNKKIFSLLFLKKSKYKN